MTGLHAAAVVGMRVCADEVVDGRHAVLLEVGRDLVGLVALGRVDEHDLPVALQQRTVALADIEIRHGQPVAGHGRRGDAGRSRGARVGGCVVAAVAEPRGEDRDDEREHDGDQMIFGLRIAAASGLGHGSHLLFDDKSVGVSATPPSRRKAPRHLPLHRGGQDCAHLRRRALCSGCIPATLCCEPACPPFPALGMPALGGERKNVCVSEYADIFSYPR